MKIYALTVGPIVGATTARSVRLWGRGILEYAGATPRRCFGVARIRPKGQIRFSQTRFFKTPPNFDMTGVAIFDGLAPETTYEYQIGCFFSDLDFKAVAALDTTNWPFDWSEANSAEFCTASEDPTRPRRFAFGSCRYLLRVLGGDIFDNRGDKTFRTILEQIKDGHLLDQFLMVGDQIYADDLAAIHPDETLAQYNRRYRAVFTQPHIKELMSRTPTYMTLNDHEIENDWPARASELDWYIKYPQAMQAYVTYQLSHSPLFAVSAEKRVTGIPHKFWYTYSDGCCDFFVTDTRTERYLPDEIEAREIISPEQLEALKNWLADGSERVKFIVSSVPFFPDIKRFDGRFHPDKWSGFPRQRNDLLDFIRTQKIRRVVFLSGDVHCSMSAELIHDDAPDFKVISIVSSPFFQPFHLIRRVYKQNFILDGELALTDGPYRLANAGPIYMDNNFTRVMADLEQVTVEVFARKDGERPRIGKVHQFEAR